MAIKKSELYSSLWRSCDEMRGGMDPSQYKDYILVLLFMKYVSDKYAGRNDALIEVPPGGGFQDMVALKGDKEIGDKINKIISRLADANTDLKGVIDVADFSDENKLGRGKEMVDRLSNLVGIFDSPDLNFKNNRADGDDILGDAYEYLMRHFATDSGKSKGQFYTPAEVSRVMAKVVGMGAAERADQTIYDPTCGSGSLLLKVHDEARHLANIDLTIYGQEMDNATAALAKMNMILHDCPTAEIWKDNTLANPYFKDDKGALKTFDFVVANPPFSFDSWSNGLTPSNDRYHRFDYGIPPEKNGDYAFLLHILASLNQRGKGAIILPHGVLFRGNAEGEIRKNLVRRGYIQGIIGLPMNLFYGTGIPACIIVLDKGGASARDGIFMVDAAKYYLKDGNKNRLREQDIHKIVDAFTRQATIIGYSRLVPNTEIIANDYNLNLPRYIDTTEPEDLQDIGAHLYGSIPDRDLHALNRYWKVFPGVRDALFAPADRPAYSNLKVSVQDIKTTIFDHPEFTTFNKSISVLFERWKTESKPLLNGIGTGDKPKALIETLSESLLTTFQIAPLLDEYDVYQHLMNYWTETMQDDMYLIVGDGWQQAAKLRPIVDDADKKSKEKPDFVVNKVKFKSDLIPPSLITARFFSTEQAEVEKLESDLAASEQSIDEMAEEHGGEEGLLNNAKDDRGKITRASVIARMKHLKFARNADDERKVLGEYLDLLDATATIGQAIREAQRALETKILEKFATLSEAEIKFLVIEDKWLATLSSELQGELDRLSKVLTEQVWQMAERYSTTLFELALEVATLSERVKEHLLQIESIK